MKTRGWKRAGSFLLRRKAQIICILCGFLLFFLADRYMRGGEEMIEGDFVKREGYGAYDRNYELFVKGLEEEEIEIEIPVSHREYSDEEIGEVFERSMQYLEENILNGNPSLQEIGSDLSLIGFIKEYGIRVMYSSEDPDLIDAFGTVYNEDLKEGVDTSLKISLTDRKHKADYIMDLRILPRQYTKEERRRKLFQESLKELDKKTICEEGYPLPKSWEGKALSYRQKSAKDYNILWMLGIFAAVLLYLREFIEAKGRRESRSRQMMIDYPDIVSKLMVFIGAGLSIRSAWENIVADYEREGVKRHAYEEMAAALGKLKTGMHEARVYRDFGRSCGLKQYMKLASLLEQNRKTGVANLKTILGMETAGAWEERINMARRAGEEASTKLLLPLFIMLGIVMAMIMIPAMMAFK